MGSNPLFIGAGILTMSEDGILFDNVLSSNPLFIGAGILTISGTEVIYSPAPGSNPLFIGAGILTSASGTTALGLGAVAIPSSSGPVF